MKILVDMNLSPEWVKFLSSNDIYSEHWSAIGSPKALDSEIYLHAREHGLIVFTHDLDFGYLLASSGFQFPSVFQVRTQNTLPENIGALVVTTLKEFKKDLESGAIITVDEERKRARILPIFYA